ncbi:hypothetical protein KEM54_003468, partial [Ascosphaera aggregata]
RHLKGIVEPCLWYENVHLTEYNWRISDGGKPAVDRNTLPEAMKLATAIHEWESLIQWVLKWYGGS